MSVRTTTLDPDAVSVLSVPGEWNHAGIYHTGDVDEPVYATLKATDPVAGEDDVLMIPKGGYRQLHWNKVTGKNVRLTSAGAATVEVEWA